MPARGQRPDSLDINIGDTREEVVQKLKATGMSSIDSSMDPEAKGLTGRYAGNFGDAKFFGTQWLLISARIDPQTGKLFYLDWITTADVTRAEFDQISKIYSDKYGAPFEKEAKKKRGLMRIWGKDEVGLYLDYKNESISLIKKAAKASPR